MHIGEEVLPVSVAEEYGVLHAPALGITRLMEMVVELSHWVRLVRWAVVWLVSGSGPRESWTVGAYVEGPLNLAVILSNMLF